MKKRILGGILAAVMCFGTGCADIQEYFRNPLQEGLQYLKDKKYTEAVAAFEEAIEKEQEPGEAYRGIGLAYWEQEDYDKAEEALTNAILNGADKTGPTYNMLAVCDWKQQDLDGALQDFQTGIQCEPKTSVLRQEMQYNVICIYEEKRDWAKAKELMAEYVAAYPDDESVKKEAEFLQTR